MRQPRSAEAEADRAALAQAQISRATGAPRSNSSLRRGDPMILRTGRLSQAHTRGSRRMPSTGVIVGETN